MLLPFVHQNPSLLPKIITSNSSLSSFPSHQPLLLHTPRRPTSKFIIFSSLSTPNTESLPKSAIQRIAEKLRSLGFTEDSKTGTGSEGAKDSAGEIFVPLSNQLPNYRVGHTLDSSWSTPLNPVPEPGTGSAISRFHVLRNEVKKEKEQWKKEKAKEERLPTLAELTLSKAELRRLSRMGMEMKKKLKVGKAGITEGIVNGIHERWRHSEVVKIVCEDLCKMNMKRTHELLERKTGGLVVWRSGSKIILYRGANYKFPYFIKRDSTNGGPHNTFLELRKSNDGDDKTESYSSSQDTETPGLPNPTNQRNQTALIQGVGSPNKVRFQLPGERELLEEADRLLEGLGPRFTDWWGYEPLPVDADLLPPMVAGFRRPFRLLPYGVSPKLTNDEMTILRRLGRPLPCHFALGRNKNLQGLAAAIIKLWEKCEIAKIAIKRGAQNTNSEMMAEEIKNLTGGTLLSRDKEFIVLYRGKDFLPPAVSSAIEERRKHVFNRDKQIPEHTQLIRTAEEIKLGTVESPSENERNDMRYLLSEKRRLSQKEAAIERTSIKLSIALEKKDKAEKLLAELEKEEIPKQPEADIEGITEEERYMLRKVGLRMKPFLLLGRRGVFDGTIENMHLHWKYRELVKIICKERSFESVLQVAQILEAESGGILVAVERVNKGYAIIVYRGKNYKRPSSLRPQTLLSKREAMKRSLEAQRRRSLKLHVLELTRNINELKTQLVKDKEASGSQVADGSKIQMTGENLDEMQAAECVTSDAEHKFSSHFNSVVSASHCENKEARDVDGTELTSTRPYNLENVSSSLTDDPHLARLINFSTSVESKAHSSDVDSESESESITDIHDASATMGESYESRDGGSEYPPNTFMAERSCSSTGNYKYNEDTNLLVEESIESQPERSASMVVNNASYKTSSKSICLSNRERLLLRKQALKMKKRPVLSVGKSNDMTGVAKAIKAHFKKHPLAIVNVKGRAKGTSVQEIVFKLEQATGAVQVSQEPSKVILYRGWGAGVEHWNTGNNSPEPRIQNSVSPELVEAIRLECGLHHDDQEKSEAPKTSDLSSNS